MNPERRKAEPMLKLNAILTAIILGVASWGAGNIEYVRHKTNELHLEIKENAAELKLQRYILEEHITNKTKHL